MPECSLIEFYLRLVKAEVACDRFVLARRRKNIEFLASLGMAIEDVKQILLDLQIENYHAGPLPDESDHGNDVWVFRSDYEEMEIYKNDSDTRHRAANVCSHNLISQS